MRLAVRGNEPVHTEVPVVVFLAEVAAVSEARRAVGVFAGLYPVVAPFPDAAAAHTRLGVYQLPPVGELAVAVAHRVVVFAEEIGA